MSSDPLVQDASNLLEVLRRARLRIATAESCTGGLIAATMTEVPGASDVLDRGFVTYSNASKTEMLGVPAAMIAVHGVVSEAVARAMAEGAVRHSGAQVAVSVTGIAGPGGGTAAKPVGLVYLAAHREGGTTLEDECRFGNIDRNSIRQQTTARAFALVRRLLT